MEYVELQVILNYLYLLLNIYLKCIGTIKESLQ
jgi:hypothetical protein